MIFIQISRVYMYVSQKLGNGSIPLSYKVNIHLLSKQKSDDVKV